MNIILTLDSGVGSDLGPNFDLTADIGTVSPSTAILSELILGTLVAVDVDATTITVTSTGACTNSLTLPITA